MNTEQASTWTCDVNELTEVKLEKKKTDPDEYNRNSDETRHWFVYQGGTLFKQSGTLKRHKRTHTGVNPFTFETCGKLFRQSGVLDGEYIYISFF